MRPFLDACHFLYWECVLHPAQKYQSANVLTKLSQVPELEQPSRGWKWFCHKYDIHSFGMGPDHSFMLEWEIICKHSDGRELGWGFPFWDKDKLEMLGQDDAVVVTKKEEQH
jgi:hypothetical protein